MNISTHITRYIALALGAVVCAAILLAAAPLLSNTLASAFNPAFSAFAPVTAYAQFGGDGGGDGSGDAGGWGGEESGDTSGWGGDYSNWYSGGGDSSGSCCST